MIGGWKSTKRLLKAEGGASRRDLKRERKAGRLADAMGRRSDRHKAEALAGAGFTPYQIAINLPQLEELPDTGRQRAEGRYWREWRSPVSPPPYCDSLSCYRDVSDIACHYLTPSGVRAAELAEELERLAPSRICALCEGWLGDPVPPCNSYRKLARLLIRAAERRHRASSAPEAEPEGEGDTELQARVLEAIEGGCDTYPKIAHAIAAPEAEKFAMYAAAAALEKAGKVTRTKNHPKGRTYLEAV